MVINNDKIPKKKKKKSNKKAIGDSRKLWLVV